MQPSESPVREGDSDAESSEKDFEAFLYKVVIVCEDFGDPMATHGSHRDAVNKPVAFVKALLV
jgi:hypothetical protein